MCLGSHGTGRGTKLRCELQYNGGNTVPTGLSDGGVIRTRGLVQSKGAILCPDNSFGLGAGQQAQLWQESREVKRCVAPDGGNDVRRNH